MNEDDFDVSALSPDVEDQLKFCLANEVKLYTTNARGKKCRFFPNI